MKEITALAAIENVEPVTDFVNAELEALDCPMKAMTLIDIVIDELFSNIAHYAYDGGKGYATVRVEVKRDPDSVILTFIDSGKPYDPLAKDDPDVTLSAQERKPGGLGIFITKKLMDGIDYEYVDGHNVLMIRKNI